jgi:hypothetical protein
MDAVDYEPDKISSEPPENQQQPPVVPPETEAMQQMLSEAFNREILLRAELVRVRRSVTRAMANQAR